MRIPPSPPQRPVAAPVPPPARAAAPATVARLLALVAQRPGVAVLLGATRAGGGGPDPAAGALVAAGADVPDAAGTRGPASALATAIEGGAVAGAVAADARPDARVAEAERVARALDVAPDDVAPDAVAPTLRVADAAARLDPAAWVPALHLPLVARLHARHPAHAAGLPHPARLATSSQLRALGRWLAERSEVATGDEELVRLARALRLDRRLVRVAAATLLVAALVLLLV